MSQTPASECFHYASRKHVAKIMSEGLFDGSYATLDGSLSQLQANIDLALAPNRSPREMAIRIDLEAMRASGHALPQIFQVARKYNMPGGGSEMIFPYVVKPEFMTVTNR